MAGSCEFKWLDMVVQRPLHTDAEEAGGPTRGPDHDPAAGVITRGPRAGPDRVPSLAPGLGPGPGLAGGTLDPGRAPAPTARVAPVLAGSEQRRPARVRTGHRTTSRSKAIEAASPGPAPALGAGPVERLYRLAVVAGLAARILLWY